MMECAGPGKEGEVLQALPACIMCIFFFFFFLRARKRCGVSAEGL